MTNSPLKGWFASLRSDTFSCHLHLCLLINPQAGAKAQRGSCKESWAASQAIVLQWHQHSDISTWLFQHIQAMRGSGASTHWLFMAPPLGTRLCEGPTESAGSKTQTGSFCGEGFAFQTWAVTVSFSQSLCGEQSWNSALRSLVLSSLTAGHQPGCISPFLSAEITPDIAELLALPFLRS